MYVCAMDSLKFLFGVVLFLLCMLVAGIVIWVMLFGIPKSAMDGGTLVNLFGQMNWRAHGLTPSPFPSRPVPPPQAQEEEGRAVER